MTKPQPLLDKDARFCCNHQHHSGVMLALYVDECGDFAGVTLQESRIELSEIFGLADYNDFDAAIDAALAAKEVQRLRDIGRERYLDRREVMAGY